VGRVGVRVGGGVRVGVRDGVVVRRPLVGCNSGSGALAAPPRPLERG
jgi:hypothetical protein